MKILLLLILVSVRQWCFNAQIPHNEHVNGAQLDIINETLTKDPFFGNFQQQAVLGYGSFGIVLHMTKQMKHHTQHFAVKIGKDSRIFENQVGTDLNHTMNINDRNLSELLISIRMTDFLRSNNVPFTPYTYTYRYILFKEPLSMVGDAALFVVQAMEYAEYGDLEKFANGYINILTEEYDTNKKKELFYDFLFKMVVSLKEINGLGILHGDIKAPNTFVEGYGRGSIGLTPILGDWDMCYQFEKFGNTRKKSIYTLYYKPPELTVYTDNYTSAITSGTTGYKFSGKEDIYALGLTAFRFAGLIKLDIDDDMEELINGMAFPWTLTEVSALLDRRGDRNRAYVDLKERMISSKDPTYVEAERRLHQRAGVIVRKIKELLDLPNKEDLTKEQKEQAEYIDDYIEEYDEAGNYYDLYEALQKAEDFCLDGDINAFKPLFDSYKLTRPYVQGFFEMIQTVKATNPYQSTIDNRWNHMRILKRLYKLLYPESEDEELSDLVSEEIEKILKYNKKYKKSYRLANKSWVHVHESFYNIKVSNIIDIFRNFDILTGFDASDYPLEQSAIKTRDNGYLFASVWNFGRDVKTKIDLIENKEKGTEFENNTFAAGLLTLERRLEQIPSGKVVKKNHII